MLYPEIDQYMKRTGLAREPAFEDLHFLMESIPELERRKILGLYFPDGEKPGNQFGYLPPRTIILPPDCDDQTLLHELGHHHGVYYLGDISEGYAERWRMSHQNGTASAPFAPRVAARRYAIPRPPARMEVIDVPGGFTGKHTVIGLLVNNVDAPNPSSAVFGQTVQVRGTVANISPIDSATVRVTGVVVEQSQDLVFGSKQATLGPYGGDSWYDTFVMPNRDITVKVQVWMWDGLQFVVDSEATQQVRHISSASTLFSNLEFNYPVNHANDGDTLLFVVEFDHVGPATSRRISVSIGKWDNPHIIFGEYGLVGEATIQTKDDQIPMTYRGQILVSIAGLNQNYVYGKYMARAVLHQGFLGLTDIIKYGPENDITLGPTTPQPPPVGQASFSDLAFSYPVKQAGKDDTMTFQVSFTHVGVSTPRTISIGVGNWDSMHLQFIDHASSDTTVQTHDDAAPMVYSGVISVKLAGAGSSTFPYGKYMARAVLHQGFLGLTDIIKYGPENDITLSAMGPGGTPNADFKLLQHKEYDAAKTYTGKASTVTFTFQLGPEQVPGTAWLGEKIAGAFATEIAKKGEQMLDLKVYEDSSPVLVTNFMIVATCTDHVPAGAAGSPFPWAVVIVLILAILLIAAVTFLIINLKSVDWKSPLGLAVGSVSLGIVLFGAAALVGVLAASKKAKGAAPGR